MKKSRVLNALTALANETRLDIVRWLVPCGTAGMSAGDIARKAHMSASRLSFHLTVLESAGLITSRKQSRHVFYRLDHRALGAVMSYMLNDCCRADPRIWGCIPGTDVLAAPTGRAPEIPVRGKSDPGP